jgi:radical SAM-linked protein
MRYRIKFQKTEAMRFTSHLDTHRTWERTLRRARLPLAYSQGFNPRPKIVLASALPLGFTSSGEFAEIWLDQDLPVGEVERLLQDADTPGLQITQVEAVDRKDPKLPNLVQSSEYLVTFKSPIANLETRIAETITSKSLVRERRGKTYDLRPLIEEIETSSPDSAGRQRMRIQLAARTGATGRPDEVLASMGISIEDARIHRTKLILSD